MIETAIREIDVEQLMQRVRVEAAKLRSANGGRATAGSARGRGSMLPPIRVLPPPPRLPLVTSVDPKRERLEGMLREARAKAEGNPSMPKFLRRFTRKQGGYNRLLIDSVAAVGKIAAQLAKRMTELVNAAEAQSRWLRAVAEYRQTDGAWMRAAAQQIGTLQDEIAELRAELETLKQQSGSSAPSGRHSSTSAAENPDHE